MGILHLPESSKTVWADILLATFLLLGAAFFNGYPLVYSDSGTYITTGMEWKVPDDRPIVYGLFLFFTSLRLSLWLPIFVQCFLMAWLLHKSVRLLWASAYERPLFWGLSFVLCMLTPLPWYSGQLMPDIFTAIQLLLLVQVLLSPSLTKVQWALYSVLYLFCCMSHFSNLFIGLAFLVFIFLNNVLFPKNSLNQANIRRHSLVVVAWSILAFLLLPLINWSLENKFILSKAGNAFLMARFIDDGLLKQYLDDRCATTASPLCIYKDSLPANSREWHWDQKSPLYKLGGWGASENVYGDVVKGMLTSPKYLGLLAWKSITRTPAQLMQNAIGSGLDYKWYRSPESPPYQAVAKYFPHEFPEYRYARQNGNLWKQELDLKFFNDLHFYVLLLSLCYLIWGYLANLPQVFVQVRSLVIASILANAFITANLASICDRFPSRIVWFLPMLAIIQAVLIYKRR
jgi:hypothetical protein